MKRYLYLLIGILMLMVMPVEACVLTYEEYKETEIQHAYIIGDYVFNMDEGYSPSLYDIAIAARSIPTTEEEYILDVYNIPTGNGKYEYEKWNIFEGGFDTNPRGFQVDVTWEYWANIAGATEEEQKALYPDAMWLAPCYYYGNVSNGSEAYPYKLSVGVNGGRINSLNYTNHKIPL